MKDTTYKPVRESSLEKYAEYLPDFLGGAVVRAKKKRKKALEKAAKSGKKD